MSDTIGIDLGTSRCAVAVVDGDVTRAVPTKSGRLTEPSFISFTSSGPVCGERARRLAEQNPRGTIFAALRLLGRKFHSPEVDWLRAACPYSIVAAPNGDVAIQVAGRDYSVAEVVSHLIEHLRRRAERMLERPVHTGVIAVPPSFDALQRAALIDAGRLAGFADLSLVNTTSAALLTWSAAEREPRRVAIVSFGAGSFDVSLADVQGSRVNVLATAGDPMLGGEDMDRRLVLHLLDLHRTRTGVDAADDPAALHALFGVARQIRHDLTERTRTEPIALNLGSLGRFELAGMSRRQLVDVITQELASLKEPCRWAFEDAGLGTDDVDPVIALGGATSMPGVQSVIKYLFRNPPVRLPHDDVAVALGAARLAASRFAGRLRRSDDSARARVAIRDVNTHSVGIKLRGGRCLTVLPRNHPLPCRASRVFEANSRSVSFEVYQGENDLATENTYLGRLSLSELGSGAFAVGFSLDESGIPGVSQIDHRTGEERPSHFAFAGGLTGDEIEQLLIRRGERAVPSGVPTQTPLPRATTLRMQREPTAARRRGTRRTTLEVEGGDAPPKRGSRRPHDTLTPPPSEPEDPSLDRIAVGADTLVGTVLGDRYLIEDVVGEGGMGRVYLAEHKLLGKRFAIKVLHPELAVNRELAERFVREARAASSIDSDHVVAISDFGLLPDGTGYFVMEYLEGLNLEELLIAEGPRDARFAVLLGRQVADALRGAHGRRIVHRDLKPSNILIQTRDGSPYCKILDFGIAKSPTSDSGSSGTTIVTMAGVMMGTPHYMAPEQIDGEVDPRSDIYALGVVLFETLAGKPPFDAESIAELLAFHKWGEPPRVHEMLPQADCPPALEEIILRCLEKEPDDRFQSARDVAEALAKV